MNKLVLTALSMVVATHAAATEAEAKAEAATEATSQVAAEAISDSSLSTDAPYSGASPVLRDPKLSKAALNSEECLVCTSHGCFSVLANSIDVAKVFVTKATNGQSVLVPY
mmetsp:Transcript_21572/g.25343  ORF Transcript_21572/g.25343 Transcript_21572/m.25343 type:complete len:111 (+) Transcript_21572:20-352(+)